MKEAIYSRNMTDPIIIIIVIETEFSEFVTFVSISPCVASGIPLEYANHR